MRYGVSGVVRVSVPSAEMEEESGEDEAFDEGTAVVQPCRLRFVGLPVTIRRRQKSKVSSTCTSF